MNRKTKLTLKDQQRFHLLNERMREIADLPPQELGFLTTPFKIAAFYVKNYSLTLFFAAALAMFFLLQLIFGMRLLNLVSILQQAF